MIRLYCEKCKCRIASGETTLKVLTGPIRSMRSELHFCETHGDELLAWISQRVPKPSASSVDDEPEPRPRKTSTRRTSTSAARSR
jgi:hypothetical protein